MPELLWTTREGAKLRPREMSDGHLLNAILMMERAAAVRAWGPLAGGSRSEIVGEMLDRAHEQSVQLSPDELAERDSPTWGAMMEEARRRKIDDQLEPRRERNERMAVLLTVRAFERGLPDPDFGEDIPPAGCDSYGSLE